MPLLLDAYPLDYLIRRRVPFTAMAILQNSRTIDVLCEIQAGH